MVYKLAKLSLLLSICTVASWNPPMCTHNMTHGVKGRFSICVQLKSQIQDRTFKIAIGKVCDVIGTRTLSSCPNAYGNGSVRDKVADIERRNAV